MSGGIDFTCPKTAFLVVGMDPLRDDGLTFAKRLEGVG